ncbi:molybdopterin converting factor subunit 1 [Virgibacillus halodenitrificans]|jgi:sulfur-carrier protein|uniref:Molybdopterin synthase sulfur carrier subunit n=1 Tax=Virgibacillus halodenitrificans TaxID=1482 RepID=A0ABR7VMY9_VIRHA|nr:molybdopterin converting factor subunit 1 [Virgibacillus halodenitrificans]MBD1221779.1 molybdopterin converting factor subunit 1 [Virgibacillus halodenitrificans]MCG1030155.1 molybdopterin converting factor subunit 1 [Virgibacillus halodenitrificans]MCJ0932314.1 molybdopterin converting factor subunit 1 [Virgibacillus halodenitrificans]MYL46203.1 molybdopterin converting factor subunit 1 [Virgibacillus halodenitrificans]MYL57784.1 molybdopterin converting factor subunit 1 [Virgibacillus ha
MIEVLFFAELREKIDSGKIPMDAAGKSVKELKEMLVAKYELKTLDNVMIAVNEEYTTESTILADDDVVAFIPPVSGG